jgi:hypothetical protein
MICPVCNNDLPGTLTETEGVYFHEHLIGRYYAAYVRITSTTNRIHIYNNAAKHPYTTPNLHNRLLIIENKWIKLTEQRIETMLLLK